MILVHLGRAGGMGTWVRIAGLRAVFEAAGAEVDEIQLRVEHRPTASDAVHLDLPAFATGRAVPETGGWSHRTAVARIRALEPAVVLCCTSRAFHPSFVDGPWSVVLDFIDRLSVSYRDRSTISGVGPKRVLFRALAWPNARFERRAADLPVDTIAAGWADAEALDAEWVPITVPIPERAGPPPVATAASEIADLLFFGNLTYPPNVGAVARLARLWPAIRAARPGTTVRIAGRNPVPLVREAAGRPGWSLVEGFDDVNALLGSARLGVVPLDHASGIQIKVLEAAAFGLPQVLSPAARAGLDPAFPACVATDDDAFVARIVGLLEDEAERAALGADGRDHMRARYTTEAWVPWAARRLSA